MCEPAGFLQPAPARCSRTAASASHRVPPDKALAGRVPMWQTAPGIRQGQETAATGPRGQPTRPGRPAKCQKRNSPDAEAAYISAPAATGPSSSDPDAECHRASISCKAAPESCPQPIQGPIGQDNSTPAPVS